MMGDGDGWVRCALGHRHWGRFGAAGLLVADGNRVVLQHRAPWTHEGGTWGLPGGARDSHEDPVAAALREAREEAAITEASVGPIGYRVEEHGGWSYTTVVAAARIPFTPHAANTESTQVRWWADDLVAELPLHRGLAASWHQLQSRPAPLVLLVADVPARDLDAIYAGMGALARYGVASADLPPGISFAGMDRLLPTIVVDPEIAPTGTHASAWWSRSIHAAPYLPAANGAGEVQAVVVSDNSPGASRAAHVGSSWLVAAVRAVHGP